MSERKVHLQNDPAGPLHNWAICGNASILFGGPMTFDLERVTCKKCLRLSQKARRSAP